MMRVSASTERSGDPGRALSPRAAGVFGAVVGLVVALAGLASTGWNPDAFVHARDGVASAELSSTGGEVGYDGQFFYRLARAPLDPAPVVAGIELDRPAYRHQRIGYPAAAWVLSAGGQPGLVPWALIAVNIAALGLLAGAGASIARHYGREPLWGALLLLWPGFLIALRLDLSDILAAALVLAGLERVLRRKPGAALWLAAAALTRETALLLPAAFGVVWLIAVLRRRTPLTRLGTSLVPLGVWGAWEGVCFAWYGKLGVLDSVTTGAPVRAVVGSIDRLAQHRDVISLAALGAVAVLAVLTIVRQWRSEAPAPIRIAAAVAVLLLFTRNWAVWTWWQGFTRAAIDMVLLGFVMMLAGGRQGDQVIVIPDTGPRIIELDEASAPA